MRPTILNRLFAPVSSLPGVGPRLSKLFANLLGVDEETGEALVVDLLWHLPSGLVDRRQRPMIAGAEPGSIATLQITVDKHRPSPPGRSRAPYKPSLIHT